MKTPPISFPQNPLSSSAPNSGGHEKKKKIPVHKIASTSFLGFSFTSTKSQPLKRGGSVEVKKKDKTHQVTLPFFPTSESSSELASDSPLSSSCSTPLSYREETSFRLIEWSPSPRSKKFSTPPPENLKESKLGGSWGRRKRLPSVSFALPEELSLKTDIGEKKFIKKMPLEDKIEHPQAQKNLFRTISGEEKPNKKTIEELNRYFSQPEKKKEWPGFLKNYLDYLAVNPPPVPELKRKSLPSEIQSLFTKKPLSYSNTNVQNMARQVIDQITPICHLVELPSLITQGPKSAAALELAQCFNNVNKAVQYYITKPTKKIEHLEKRYETVLAAAIQCLREEDFEASYALYSALNAAAIARLKLGQNEPVNSDKRALDELFSSEGNFRNLRKTMTKAKRPALAPLWQEWTFAGEGNEENPITCLQLRTQTAARIYEIRNSEAPSNSESSPLLLRLDEDKLLAKINCKEKVDLLREYIVENQKELDEINARLEELSTDIERVSQRLETEQRKQKDRQEAFHNQSSESHCDPIHLTMLELKIRQSIPGITKDAELLDKISRHHKKLRIEKANTSARITDLKEQIQSAPDDVFYERSQALTSLML